MHINLTCFSHFRIFLWLKKHPLAPQPLPYGWIAATAMSFPVGAATHSHSCLCNTRPTHISIIT